MRIDARRLCSFIALNSPFALGVKEVEDILGKTDVDRVPFDQSLRHGDGDAVLETARADIGRLLAATKIRFYNLRLALEANALRSRACTD